MMQATDLGYGNNTSGVRTLNGPRFRRVFLQSQVRSAAMVIVDECAYVTPQTRFVEDDHVVQTLAADGPDNSLDVSALPRRPGEQTRSA